jgi:large subunit ribosomal protein L25
MTLQLQLIARSTSKADKKKLRATGFIPAVLYGHGTDNQNVAIQRSEFEKVYKAAGESTIISVTNDKKPAVNALIQDIDRHPTSGEILHVDLFQVRMDEKITHDIPLHYIGESKAIKELGGILVKSIDNLTVRCLPADLPSELVVDLSMLEDFESRITVSDIKMPKGVELEVKPDEVVAVVEPPRTEEELKALDEKVEENVEAVEKVEKEVPAEGEAEEGAETTGVQKEK